MDNLNQRELFASNLNRYMKERGVTQADIVVELGVTSSTASDWSKGKKYPRVDAMQKLANLLSVKVSDLTGDQKDMMGELVDEDEKELISIFRKLRRREKHELMAKAYELEKEIRKGNSILRNP